jgi:hypothetical protein
MGTLIGILILLFMLSPAIGISLTTQRPVRVRVVWGLVALLPIPLAFGGWVAALSILKPPGGIHSSYSMVAALFAIFAPWVVYGLFKRTLPPNAN